MVVQERRDVCETVGSVKCTSFELTKKYICFLKIVKNSGHKLQVLTAFLKQ